MKNLLAVTLLLLASTAGAQTTELNVPPGFKAELIYSVPNDTQGSWISICFDDKGRIITSDQFTKLYRVTVPPLDEKVKPEDVEALEVGVGQAQGLVHAYGSLYVVQNGKPSGLYRLRDTNGDDHYDEVKLLRPLEGAGGHGPHAVLKTPDGEGLYLVMGNHTLPTEFTKHRLAPVWGEDQLLPRLQDTHSGHAAGVRAPGGWIARTDPDGKEWEFIAGGFRNTYDIAYNRAGDIFTFDADMEYDMGTPWYRPTRICLVPSGAEFGWRMGSGKWTPDYPDSLPGIYDIGPSSPTGMLFGYDAKFPTKYRDALYALDWTYGAIFALHLEPDGASFKATCEEFLTAAPLPSMDMETGPDGAMYFVTGGRGIQSGLYRIQYVGDKSTAEPAIVKNTEPEYALRMRLEKFHGVQNPKAIDAAWPHLDHADRFVRFAARTAIEHQPVAAWRDRALSETAPGKLIAAMVALARLGEPSDQPATVEALGRVDVAALSEFQKIDLMRAYALTFIRLGAPDAEQAAAVAERLNPHYPDASLPVNREMARVLTYLQAPGFVDKTLGLMFSVKEEKVEIDIERLSRSDQYGLQVKGMAKAQPMTNQMHFAQMLSHAEDGWTLESRRAYFKWFNKAHDSNGGLSYRGFLANIKQDALSHTPDDQREALLPITGEKEQPKIDFTTLPLAVGPPVVWTQESAMQVIGAGPTRRSFENGKKMYAAARCVTCHRLDGEGGSLGPDLTNLGNRFGYADVLDAIIQPSRIISDQFAAVMITQADGTVSMGLIIREDDDKIELAANPYDPYEVVAIAKSQITSREYAPVSLMPPALINALNKDELLDLMAYVMSRGNSGDKRLFAQPPRKKTKPKPKTP
ncbi:MAG: c-type cytochrome [Planctomycetota bacterium]|jgi:putative heme-binding domain-containing protein